MISLLVSANSCSGLVYPSGRRGLADVPDVVGGPSLCWPPPPPIMFEIERRAAALKGDLAGNRGRIAALKEQIGEAELQIEGLMSAHAKEVSEDLRSVQGQRAEIEEALRKAASKVARSEIRAPQEGTILNMRAFAPAR